MASNRKWDYALTIGADTSAVNEVYDLLEKRLLQMEKQENVIHLKCDTTDFDSALKEIAKMKPEIVGSISVDFTDRKKLNKQLDLLNSFVNQKTGKLFTGEKIGKGLKDSIEESFSTLNIKDLIQEQLGEGKKLTEKNVKQVVENLSDSLKGFNLARVTDFSDLVKQLEIIEQARATFKELSKDAKFSNTPLLSTLNVDQNYTRFGNYINTAYTKLKDNLTEKSNKQAEEFQSLIDSLLNRGNGIGNGIEDASDKVDEYTDKIKKANSELKKLEKAQKESQNLFEGVDTSDPDSILDKLEEIAEIIDDTDSETKVKELTKQMMDLWSVYTQIQKESFSNIDLATDMLSEDAADILAEQIEKKPNYKFKFVTEQDVAEQKQLINELTTARNNLISSTDITQSTNDNLISKEQYDDTLSKLISINKEYETQKQQIETLNNQLSNSVIENNNLSERVTKLEEVNKELEKYRKQAGELFEKLSLLDGKDINAEEFSKLQADYNELSEAFARSKDEIVDLENSLARAFETKLSLDAKEKELENLTKQLEEAQQASSAAKKEIDSLSTALKEAKQNASKYKLDVFEETIKHLNENKFDKAAAYYGLYVEALQRGGKQAKKAIVDNVDYTDELLARYKELNEATKNANKTEEYINKLNTANKEVLDLQKKVDLHKKEIEQLKEKITEQEKLNKLEKEADRVAQSKAEKQSKKQSQIKPTTPSSMSKDEFIKQAMSAQQQKKTEQTKPTDKIVEIKIDLEKILADIKKVNEEIEKSIPTKKDIEVSVSFTKNELDINNEKSVLTELNDYIVNTLIPAINEKTKAFENEAVKVSEVVSNEKNNLDDLYNSIKRISDLLKEKLPNDNLLNYLKQLAQYSKELKNIKFTTENNDNKSASNKDKSNGNKNLNSAYNETFKLQKKIFELEKKEKTTGLTERETDDLENYNNALAEQLKIIQKLNKEGYSNPTRQAEYEKIDTANKKELFELDQFIEGSKYLNQLEANKAEYKRMREAIIAEGKRRDEAIELYTKLFDQIDAEGKNGTTNYNQLLTDAEEINEINTQLKKYAENLKNIISINETGKQTQTTAYLEKLKELLTEISKAGKNEGSNVIDLAQLREDAKRIIDNINETLNTKSNPENLLGNTNTLDKYSAKIQKFMRDNDSMGAGLRARFNTLLNDINDLNIGTDVTKKQVNDILTRMLILEDEAHKTGQIGKSMLTTIKERLTGINAQLIAQYMSWQDIVRYIKTSAQTVKDLDTALTEMRKVSDESVDSLKKYQQQTFRIADDVGSTALSLQNSTADWMRLGETLDQARESAKQTAILLNVSEFEGVNEATQSLVSMSQAYKELEKSEIIDVLNNIGNNYQISTNQLAEGLKDSAAVLKTQGNDLNEAVALLTAGNAITQDVSKTAGGIRTISLRLAGTEEAKQELQDLGEEVEDYVVMTTAKKRQIIKDYTSVASNAGLGVDILDANGNLKNTYTILLEIAKVYKEIQKEDKQFGTNRAQALIEEIAGKNRSNIAASILENPELLASVYESAQKSEGSAEEELDKYLESIEGKLAKFQNKLQQLESTFISNEAVKFIIDSGTTILSVVDSIIERLGGVPTSIGLIAGALSALKNVGKPNCATQYADGNIISLGY